MITDTELERIERLAEEATPGPWTTEKPAQAPGEVFANGVIIAAVARGQGIYSDPPGGSFPESDRRFIAASREAIPALISSVRKIRARAEAAEAENERLRSFRDFAWRYIDDKKLTDADFRSLVANHPVLALETHNG